MPGIVPVIHVLFRDSEKDVDGRDKPGHDDESLMMPSACELICVERNYNSRTLLRQTNPSISPMTFAR